MKTLIRDDDGDDPNFSHLTEEFRRLDEELSRARQAIELSRSLVSRKFPNEN